MEILNHNIESISEYPFSRLRNLLAKENPNPQNKVLDMSIGQPLHKFPEYLKNILFKENKKWALYPPIQGIPSLRNAYLRWVKKRFNLKTSFFSEVNIMPLSGTREGLFSISLVLLVKKIIVPNPFYQVYLGSSLFQNLPIELMNVGNKECYLMDLEKLEFQIKKTPSLIYFCNPSNPQGKCASEFYIRQLIKLVRKYNSVLVIDECYTDIYTKKVPVGGMQVCEELGEGLKNILIFHSLSKRSNVAGIRSGFVIGDEKVIKLFSKLRSYSAPTIPIPIQILSSKLWQDETHVIQNRQQYKIKLDYADKVLSHLNFYERPDAGFYLWLNVKDGEEFTRKLFQNYSLRVMPGLYLAKNNYKNPGKKFVRVSLVHSFPKCKTAINQIKEQIECLQS